MDKILESRAVTIRNFNRFYTNMIGLVNQTILDSPYSLAEARVLLEIDQAGQCTASDLTKLLDIDPGYLSRILTRFIKEQLVAKSKSSTDGRAYIVSITAKGREAFQQLSGASTRQIAKILEGLPDSSQERLVCYMHAIQTILGQRQDKSAAIRSKKPGDASYIAWRHSVLYESEYGLGKVFEQYVMASLEKFLTEQPPGNIWVAEVDGQIAGFIGIVGINETTAQLRWFLLEPEFRGLGLGRRLMTTAMDYCRQQNFQRVFLWTFQELAAARHLYHSLGFVPVEQVANDAWKSNLVEERWEINLV